MKVFQKVLSEAAHNPHISDRQFRTCVMCVFVRKFRQGRQETPAQALERFVHEAEFANERAEMDKRNDE